MSGDQLAKLDQFEWGYSRVQATVQLYEEDGGGTVETSVYFATPETLAGKRELKESNGDYNYRDTVVRGAKELGLKAEYIEYLMSLPVIESVKWDEEWIQSQEWYSNVYTMDSVRESQPLCTLFGWVMDTSKSEDLFKVLVKKFNSDLSPMLLKRWAYCDDALTTADPSKFPDGLRSYLGCFLMRIFQGKKKAMFVPVGRLDDSEVGNPSNFDFKV